VVGQCVITRGGSESVGRRHDHLPARSHEIALPTRNSRVLPHTSSVEVDGRGGLSAPGHHFPLGAYYAPRDGHGSVFSVPGPTRVTPTRGQL